MSSSEVIEVEHFYSHPPAAVWKVLTTPELHARWWVPGNVRAEVGHKFDLDMGNGASSPARSWPSNRSG